MYILAVEDEPKMAELLRSALAEEGYFVTLAGDGESALEFGKTGQFDLILLDCMLPRMDGITVTRRLRELHIQTPVLMLTARDAIADIVRALDSGADDYLTKPFSLQVLLARVRAVSRRGEIAQPVCLEAGGVRLNTSSREVTRDGKPVGLTPREYSLLELLLRHKGRVLSRRKIVESIWGFDSDVEENTLEAFIRLLRNKIDPPQSPKLIQTVRGVGYSLREPVG